MQIAEIAIKNFRSITEINQTLDKVQAITGKNGAGKSSVIYAIQYALFGFCEKTSRSGQRAGDLIRHGAKGAGIILDFKHAGNGYELQCGIHQKAKQDWQCICTETGELYGTREALWRHLDINMAVAEAAAMPHAWMLSGEAGGLLAALMLPKDIKGAMLARLGPVRKWFVGYADDFALKLESLQDFRDAGNDMYAARTFINRDLKTAKTDLEAMPFQALPKDTDGNVLETGALPGIILGMESLAERRDALLQQRAVEEAVAAGGDVAQERKDFDAAEAEYLKTDQALDDVILKLSSAWKGKESLAVIRERLESLGNAKTCSLCEQKLTAKAIKERETQRGKLAKQLKAAEKIEELCVAWRTERGGLEEARRAASAKVASATANIERLEAQAESMKDSQVVPAEDLANTITETEAQLERGEMVVQRLDANKVREETEVYIAATEIKVKAMTKCITAYKDGKAENEIVAGKLEGFLVDVNADLELYGYQIEVIPEGKVLTFMLCEGEGNTPYALCSPGEQATIAYCAGKYLALEGRSPVLFDNANHLDSEKRDAMIVRAKRQDLDNSVIFAWASQNETLADDCWVLEG